MFLPRVPLSANGGLTYIFMPRDFLRGLFGVYGMDLPTEFTNPDLNVLQANDTIPSNINSSTISYIGEFLPVSWGSSYLTRAPQYHSRIVVMPFRFAQTSHLMCLVIKDG